MMRLAFALLLFVLGQACGQQYIAQVTVTYSSTTPASMPTTIPGALIQQASNGTLALLGQQQQTAPTKNVSTVVCGGQGTYADAASGTCKMCTVCTGQYQVSACVYTDAVCADQCPQGMYGHAGGAPAGALGSCTACSPGTFAMWPGRDACAQCPSQTYASTYGATACTACSPGQTAAPGATACVLTVRFFCGAACRARARI